MPTVARTLHGTVDLVGQGSRAWGRRDAAASAVGDVVLRGMRKQLAV